MAESEDDSILDNLQKTRELWSNRADVGTTETLFPKSPISPTKSSSPVVENHYNGHQEEEDIVRFEDKQEDDFDMPDVKSIKSQWEKPGPIPVPQKKAPTVKRSWSTNRDQPPADLVPVNREPEETKEEYEVQIGNLRDKFEKQAKAAKSKVVWDDGPRTAVSKAAVDQRVSIFEVEIEAQKRYHSTKEGPVEMPAVELSSIKKQFEQRKDEKMVVPTRRTSVKKTRPASMYATTNAPAAEVVRYDDPPTQEVHIDIELSSLRKKFESGPSSQRNTQVRSHTTVEKKVSDPPIVQRTRASSDSENIEVVRSSDAKFDEMIGEESVKERLASLNSRYKAMTEQAKVAKPNKTSFARRSTTNIVIKEKVVEETEVKEEHNEVEIVRSPPAGTKEKAEYTTSVDLEQARQVFEQRSDSPSRRSRSSRSSSASSRRRSPRSQSTPSPIHRGSRASSSSSKSPSPARDGARSSASNSSHSSGRKSQQKKIGDPDIVVLEHTEVNYYYDEDGKRLSTKLVRPGDPEYQEADMSNVEVIRPNPAGTKEEVDYVPSVNMHSVRDMFENPKEDSSRGRSPPKKTIIIEKDPPRSDSAISASPERNPDIVRSTTAGAREEIIFEVPVDLKAARSKFESPNRPEQYVPRNTIRQREEEARQRRAAAAAASPRSSESSDTSSEVVKNTEAGSKEKPDYHVDLKAAKQLFEGGKAPVQIKRENSSSRRKQNEVKGEVIRPEPAGTKEVVEIKASNDLKSVKQKFEGAESGEPEEPTRKAPINIQEESRMVLQKEQEVKEEVKKLDEETKQNAESSSSSESELTDTEGEAILQHDDDDDEVIDDQTDSRVVVSDTIEEDRESVSSEELVTQHEAEDEYNVKEDSEEEDVEEKAQVDDKEENIDEPEQEEIKEEEANEEPAAAVVPVRVAITEDLTEKTAEEEPKQDYETYTKVVDYNEEAQPQPQSSSDSESEKEVTSEKEVREAEQNGVEESKQELIEALAAEDGLKTNVIVNNHTDGDAVANHLNDSLSSEEDQKGISSSSSNLDESQQQLSLSSSSQSNEAQGKAGDFFSDFSQTNNIQPSVNTSTNVTDLFSDFDNVVGPPQLAPETKQLDPFEAKPVGSGANDPFDPFSSNPTPPPRKQHIQLTETKDSDNSLLDGSEDDDYDKPHFNYPFDEEESTPDPTSEKPEVTSEKANVSNNNNNMDIFGLGDLNVKPQTNSKPLSGGVDLLSGFDSTPVNNGPSNDPFAAFGAPTAPTKDPFADFTAPAVSNGPTQKADDSFDLFGAPLNQTSSTAEKDPFDLFA